MLAVLDDAHLGCRLINRLEAQSCSISTQRGETPGIVIVSNLDCRLRIFDLSMKPSTRAKQAHFNNRKSTIINRQSMQRRVAPQQPDKEMALRC